MSLEKEFAREIVMSKALVLTVVFLVCVVMLGIARYDAHYADRIHHSQVG
jgi:hypothetical protein